MDYKRIKELEDRIIRYKELIRTYSESTRINSKLKKKIPYHVYNYIHLVLKGIHRTHCKLNQERQKWKILEKSIS